jgi:hypothetical protein
LPAKEGPLQFEIADIIFTPDYSECLRVQEKDLSLNIRKVRNSQG